MTAVKICGVRRVEDAVTAVDAGADFVGLVFAPSRRQVDLQTAVSIGRSVRRRQQTRLVGVFVNAGATEMNRVAKQVGLDLVQLSGDEPDDLIGELSLPAIQVVHVRPETTPDELHARVAASPAAMLLLDTASAHSYGGNGRAFDWSMVPRVQRRLFVAGGLTPENVADAIGVAAPWGVDVSSGVEIGGDKDPARITAFIERAKGRMGAEEPLPSDARKGHAQ